MLIWSVANPKPYPTVPLNSWQCVVHIGVGMRVADLWLPFVILTMIECEIDGYSFCRIYDLTVTDDISLVVLRFSSQTHVYDLEGE